MHLLELLILIFSLVYAVAIGRYFWCAWGKSWQEKKAMIWRHKIRTIAVLISLIPFLALCGSFLIEPGCVMPGPSFQNDYTDETWMKVRIYCKDLSNGVCDTKLKLMEKWGYTTEEQYKNAVDKICQGISDNECRTNLYELAADKDVKK